MIIVSQKSYNNDKSNLYLIPTPIGNLEDITVRSLNLLKKVDFILCEDTRVTGSLLKKYNIKKKLISCYEYNEDKVKDEVIKYLEEGKNIGLVTDQGTPIISDPGFKVVKEVINLNKLYIDNDELLELDNQLENILKAENPYHLIHNSTFFNP